MVSRSYKDLLVWRKSMDLVKAVYIATENFPKAELFGLCSQVRRAVISIPSNIAEGQGRDSAKEFVHHLSFAYGSLMEAETQLQISAELGYIGQAEVDRLLSDTAEIGRLLNGLSRSIRNAATN